MKSRLFLLAIVATFLATHSAQAQRPYILLPRTHGATVLSTYIDAESRRIVASGIYLESRARANLTQTEADRRSIENARLWLETYFERKKINEEYRRAKNPSYIEQEKRRDAVRERTIVDLPSEIANGDVTDDLNWLLGKLLANSSSYELMFSETLGDVAHFDLTLTPEELTHISLRESTGREGGGQSFRADSPSLISISWPIALSGKEFAVEGAAFEEAREQAVAESKADGLTRETWVELRSALDRLTHRFNEVYSREALKDASGNDRVLLRSSGKRFLQAQAVGVARALTVKDIGALEGRYTFTDSSVVELLRHCGRNGLEFAPPGQDDRSVYVFLFNHVRQIYLEFN